MHITSIDVISKNGKITRGNEADGWASGEDWEHFQKVRQEYGLIVMGRGTYESIKPRPEPGLFRVVLTHHPERYEDQVVPNQLEFFNQTASELVGTMEKRGFERMLLAGGRSNTQFLAAGLITDMWVTTELYIFGEGQDWLEGLPANVTLSLKSRQTLNERGTLLEHFSIDKITPLA